MYHLMYMKDLKLFAKNEKELVTLILLYVSKKGERKELTNALMHQNENYTTKSKCNMPMIRICETYIDCS